VLVTVSCSSEDLAPPVRDMLSTNLEKKTIYLEEEEEKTITRPVYTLYLIQNIAILFLYIVYIFKYILIEKWSSIHSFSVQRPGCWSPGLI
jgi:uncharacterized membrane protein